MSQVIDATMTPLCAADCGERVPLLSLEDVALTRKGWVHARCLGPQHRVGDCLVCWPEPCLFPKEIAGNG